jgi:hypothetical protein
MFWVYRMLFYIYDNWILVIAESACSNVRIHKYINMGVEQIMAIYILSLAWLRP